MRKSLRAVGAKSGEDYTDIGGDVRLGGQRAFEPSVSVRRGDGTDFGKTAFSHVELSPASSLATARKKFHAVAVGRQIGIFDKCGYGELKMTSLQGLFSRDHEAGGDAGNHSWCEGGYVLSTDGDCPWK